MRRIITGRTVNSLFSSFSSFFLCIPSSSFIYVVFGTYPTKHMLCILYFIQKHNTRCLISQFYNKRHTSIEELCLRRTAVSTIATSLPIKHLCTRLYFIQQSKTGHKLSKYGIMYTNIIYVILRQCLQLSAISTQNIIK